ncbi:Ycf48-like protein [Rubripirellula lacrimiformis]|uniref:Ycf48-like protein n=1 Tax=Rubripirellula lacrimiformis TaxID=1930273 RepID=A0A517NLC4_9BACT|nr:hypothetical protein [Rubripirellula lacrimiformis]QDT07879.1 Ycf48-like protein [Rubripirellula lacrimiformis]
MTYRCFAMAISASQNLIHGFWHSARPTRTDTPHPVTRVPFSRWIVTCCRKICLPLPISQVGGIAILLLGIATASAASPELPPAYSQTRLLRSQAALNAVAFYDDQLGVAVGDRGRIMKTSDGGQTWTPSESGVECRIDDLIWIDAQRMVAVGGGYDAITRISRGVVLISNDGGNRWQRGADNDLPRLRKIQRRDDGKLTADGDWSHPSLTHQFESRSDGRTWTGNGNQHPPAPLARTPDAKDLLSWVQTTSVPVAVRAACRIAANRLCAVGDHGVIMTSDDNGKTWTTRAGQDRHTAILFVAASAPSVAWSMVGSESLESRNRTTVLVDLPPSQQNQQSDPANQPSQLELAHQVAVMLGASGVDTFGRTDNSDDNVRMAMRWIAILQPSAVVLDQNLAPETLDAFFQAATTAGVQRVASYTTGQSQSTTLHRDALLPKTGILASDLAYDALHHIAPHQNHVESISLRYLYDANPSRRTGESVTSGLNLSAGQRLPDRSAPASRRQLQVVQARMKQSKRIEQLLNSKHRVGSFDQSLATILDQTAKEDQFRLAWSILAATSDASLSDIRTRQTVLGVIAQRFADRSAGHWAKVRLQSLTHSVERRRLEEILTTGGQTADRPIASVSRSIAVSPFQSIAPEAASPTPTSGGFSDGPAMGQVRQVSAIAPVIVPEPEMLDMPSAPKATPSSEVDLAWEFHPIVLLGGEASRNRSDRVGLQIAEEQPASLRRLADATSNPWSGLLRRRGPQVVRARRTASPPRLDGMTNDSCWSESEASANSDTSIRMAYDDDYIYVAVECPEDRMHPDSHRDSASGIRDDDLSMVDRLSLCLDIDGDLMTSMQLSASASRRTHDAIDGNPAWQPTWYLDAAYDKGYVTFEIAILRRDVVDLPIEPGSTGTDQSWFVSARPLAAGTSLPTPVIPDPADWVRVIFQ